MGYGYAFPGDGPHPLSNVANTVNVDLVAAMREHARLAVKAERADLYAICERSKPRIKPDGDPVSVLDDMMRVLRDREDRDDRRAERGRLP